MDRNFIQFLSTKFMWGLRQQKRKKNGQRLVISELSAHVFLP